MNSLDSHNSTQERVLEMFAVPSTMHLLSERAERLFGSGRPMTFVEWEEGTHHSTHSVDVRPCITFDEDADVPFESYSANPLNGPGFIAYLKDATFNIHTEVWETEESVRERFYADDPEDPCRDVLYVHIVGGREGECEEGDRISITWCDSYARKTHTVVSFSKEND